MKFRYILSVIAIVVVTTGSYAQYNQDAFRFSTSQQGTTSRFKAIGNASTALGGDISSISSNPAGLGFFSKSEFSFTPEFNSTKITSTYFGQTNEMLKENVNLNNIGVVFSVRTSVPKGSAVDKGLLSFGIGLSYSRTNNFYEDTYYAGRNANNSIADYYVEQANKNSIPEGSLQGWGFDHFLIDEVSTGKYRSNTAFGADQVNDIITTGGQNEFNISVGANHSNQFYFGAGIGLASLKYNKTSVFTEVGNQYIDDLDYTTRQTYDQETTGNGINLKLGVIFKPTDAFRIGASFTSPTWYNVKDITTLGLRTNYVGSNTYISGPEEYEVNYDLRTPSKLNGGIALFLKKTGFISADVEYVNYSGIKLGGDYSYNENVDNRRIAKQYKSAVNARIGGEAKLNKILIRAGYNLQANPERGIGSDIETISGGLGYRFGSYYLDLTYTNVLSKPTVYPYELDPEYSPDPTNVFVSPSANLKKTNDNVFLTFGIRF